MTSRRSLIASVLAAGLLAAAPASAHEGVHEHVERRPLPMGGTALRVQHIDTPSFGQSRAAYAGAARADGAVTDRALRDDAHDAPLASAAAPAADSQATGSAPAPATTWCGTERATDDTANERTTLPRYKVIYARPKNLADSFATYQDLIQQAPTWAANTIAASASGLRAPRFDYGTSCGAQYVDIASIVLPRTAATYQAMTIDQRASALDSDLSAALPSLKLSSGQWNYLVFADRVSPANDPRSVGYLYMDDTPGPANANAQGGLAAFIMGSGGSDFVGDGEQDYLAYSVTHELGHTLGAVQDGAPHSTGSGHCTDGFAIMCYDDGGPNGGAYTQSACSGPLGTTAASYAGVAFDCSSDDYISAAPATGSWLSTHWNLFDSPFMCDTASCTASTVAPAARLTAAQTTVPAGTTVTLDASQSSDPDGTIAGYRFDLDGDGTFETDRGTTATAALRRDGPAVVTVAVQVTDNDGLTSTARLTITFSNRAPVARIAGPGSATAGTPIVLDGGTSSDPDLGERLTARWTDDAGRVLGTGWQVAYAPSTAGTHTVTLVVTDAAGATGSATQTVAVAAPPAPAPDPTPPPAEPAAPATDPAPPATSATTPAGQPRPRVTRVRARRHGRVELRLRCPKGKRACRAVVNVAVRGRHRGGRSTVVSGRRRLQIRVRAGASRTLRFKAPHARRGRRAQMTLVVGSRRVWRKTVTLR